MKLCEVRPGQNSLPCRKPAIQYWEEMLVCFEHLKILKEQKAKQDAKKN